MLVKPDLNKPAFLMFPAYKDRIIKGECPMCGGPIVEAEFTNEISREEFSISGMCPQCQEVAFTLTEDDEEAEPNEET